MELIDRLGVMKVLDEAKIKTTSEEYDRIIDVIGSMPTIEERKKGRWRARSRKISNTGIYYWRDCSACGWIREDCIKANDTPYCPNCGAKMEGSDRDAEKL